MLLSLVPLLASLTASCHPNCATCGSLLVEWDCLSCNPGFFLQPFAAGLCLNYCPTGYISNIASALCESGSNDIIVDYVLDQIVGEIEDRHRGWRSLNGLTDAYYPPVFEASDPVPVHNRGYYFFADQVVLFPPYPGSTSPSPLFSSDMSVMSWLRLSSYDHSILSLHALTATSPQENAFVLRTDSLGRLQLDTRGMQFVGSTGLVLDQWHCIAATTHMYVSSGNAYTTGSLYVDGLLDSVNSVLGYVHTDIDQSGGIGWKYDIDSFGSVVRSDFFEGFVYELKLFNHPLSLAALQSEIRGPTQPASSSFDLSACGPGDYMQAAGGCAACPSGCYWGCERPTSCYLCVDPLCAVCSSFARESCRECITNANLVASTCVCANGYQFDADAQSCSQCAEGFFRDASDACVSCHFSCKDCSGPGSAQCTSCLDHSSLATPHSCTCDSGFFALPLSGQCERCAPSCYTCTRSDSCTGCHPHAALQTEVCECERGYWPDPTSANCSLCHKTCSECVGASQSDCVACQAGLLLSPSPVGDCVCPLGCYLVESPSLQCEKCGEGCNVCYDGRVCWECVPPLELRQSGECLSECFDASQQMCEIHNNPSKCFSASLGETQLGLALNFTAELRRSLQPADISIAFSKSGVDIYSEPWELIEKSPKWSYEVLLPSLFNAFPNTTARLSFTSPSSLYSENCSGLATPSLSILLGNSTSHPEQSSTLALGHASVGAMATSLVSGLVFTSSFSLLWTFLHNFQLISYIPMSNIPLPERLRYLLISANPFELVPNPFEYIPNTNQTRVPPHIEHCQIETLDLWRNVGPSVVTIAAFFGVSMCYVILKFAPVNCVRNWAAGKACKKVRTEFPRVWIELYLTLCIGVCLQVYSVAVSKDSVDTLYGYSSVASAVLVGSLLCSTIVVSHFAVIDRIQTGNDSGNPLFDEFSETKSIATRFHFVFFSIRRALFAATQVFLPNFPIAQGVLNLTHCFYVTPTQFSIYTSLFLRYQSKTMRTVSVSSEIGVTLVFIQVQIFFIDLSAVQRDAVEMTVIATIGAVFLVHFLGMSYLVGMKVYAVLRDAQRRWKVVHYAGRKKEL